MKQRLNLTTKQQLHITPQIQQALKLLQLSSQELEQEIKLAIESNPLLESLDDFNIPAHYENYEPAEPNHTLHDYLYWQLDLTNMSDADRVIALTIIDAIDDKGYLTGKLDDIDAHQNEISAVLHRIQQFDPIGVGSRDLAECLLIQLNSMPENTPYLDTCKQLVSEDLDLLAKKNYSQIQKIFKLSDNDLSEVLNIITHLHPYPGELIATQKSEYIIPDLTVSKNNDAWVVTLNKKFADMLRINQLYQDYLPQQLIEARWLLTSLQTRDATLLKVTESIMRRQEKFLELGTEHIQPMILHDIANDVGLNESTISRAISNKYVTTPQGVFSLKFFFSSKLTNNAGMDFSSAAIKAMIKELTNQQHNGQKLSDQAISDIMAERGIKISRRSINKYRNQR